MVGTARQRRWCTATGSSILLGPSVFRPNYGKSGRKTRRSAPNGIFLGLGLHPRPAAGHVGLLLCHRTDPGRGLGPGARPGAGRPHPVDPGPLLGTCRRAQPRRDPAPTPGAQRAVARSFTPAEPIRYRPSRPRFAHASRTSLRAAPICSSAAAPAWKAATDTSRFITTARLSDRKLATLTAIHNFHIRRPDDTTPPSASSGGPPPRYSSRC